MNFKRITPYLHQYDLDFYDYLEKNKVFINKLYQENLPLPKGVYNAFLSKGEVYDFINNKLLNLVHQYYLLAPLYLNTGVGIYKQDNTQNFRGLHNHIETSSLNTIMYLDPPPKSEGGEITFYFTNENQVLTLSPLPGKLYVFPSWVQHTPEPQTSSTPRYSLNWGYMSHTRPIHKISADHW